uniref:Ovule protein n=1 Tax=Romanomermis culicivorax TaxID=13658 RepID=A0A915K8J7_ROMCU
MIFEQNPTNLDKNFSNHHKFSSPQPEKFSLHLKRVKQLSPLLTGVENKPLGSTSFSTDITIIQVVYKKFREKNRNIITK